MIGGRGVFLRYYGRPSEKALAVSQSSQVLVDASASDPLRAVLEFDAAATGFVRAMEKCK
jgi:hypothetical protein